MIAIVDYGMGNLRSVEKAFEKVGCSAEITNRTERIDRADKIVVPGVGAFEDAMNELRRKRPVILGEGTNLAELPGAGSRPPGLEENFDDELAALRKCLNELGDEDRGVLADRYEKSAPLASIAARCGQNVGYMKQRLFRLRKRLAECIRRRMLPGGMSSG